MKVLLLLIVVGSLLACDPSIAPGKAEIGEVGAACGVPEDCTEVSDPVCLAMGAAGYCASDCSALGQLLCPAGSVCEQLGDQAIMCMDGCCGAGDCRDGFRCDRRPELDIYVDATVCFEPGICLLSCTSDLSCGQGQVCAPSSGKCVPKIGANSGVGAACDGADKCNSGTCLGSYPGGYCTSACGTQFSGCEPGSECFGWRGATPTCMARCESHAQCRAGYRCEISAEEQGGSSVRAFCVPRCDAFGSCPDGTACDPVGGACVEGAPPASPIGAFCRQSSDCDSGDCETTWPNGYCTASCGTCAAGASCVEGRCLADCSTANDCRFRYVCLAGGCEPGCESDDDCGGALVCDTASGLCVSPTVGTTVQEFTTTSVSVSASGSADVNFTVPRDALSVVLHADDGQQTLMAVLQLVGPGNTVLYDIQDPATSKLTLLPTDGTFSGMFPNSPNINLVPGDYRVSFLRETGTANTSIRVFGKVAAGFPARQTLPLAFYFVGAPAGLTAASAPSDSRFKQAFSEFTAIYASLGVDLDPPIYEDVGNAAALKVIDTVNGAGSELSQLLRRGTRENTLQFYFVEEILGGESGYTILGIAGGIPGPPGPAPGPHAGVAVTVAGTIERPALLGQVMAHEGAHYLGLFHTSEATGTTHDPLPDTPSCPASRDANWDGYVSPDECVGLGADNFMFWSASGTARATSAEQGRVLRRNPLTQ